MKNKNLVAYICSLACVLSLCACDNGVNSVETLPPVEDASISDTADVDTAPVVEDDGEYVEDDEDVEDLYDVVVEIDDDADADTSYPAWENVTYDTSTNFVLDDSYYASIDENTLNEIIAKDADTVHTLQEDCILADISTTVRDYMLSNSTTFANYWDSDDNILGVCSTTKDINGDGAKETIIVFKYYVTSDTLICDANGDPVTICMNNTEYDLQGSVGTYYAVDPLVATHSTEILLYADYIVEDFSLNDDNVFVTSDTRYYHTINNYYRIDYDTETDSYSVNFVKSEGYVNATDEDDVTTHKYMLSYEE